MEVTGNRCAEGSQSGTAFATSCIDVLVWRAGALLTFAGCDEQRQRGARTVCREGERRVTGLALHSQPVTDLLSFMYTYEKNWVWVCKN